nr:unnamed protein product [Digitaria exilis]
MEAISTGGLGAAATPGLGACSVAGSGPRAHACSRASDPSVSPGGEIWMDMSSPEGAPELPGDEPPPFPLPFP